MFLAVRFYSFVRSHAFTRGRGRRDEKNDQNPAARNRLDLEGRDVGNRVFVLDTRCFVLFFVSSSCERYVFDIIKTCYTADNNTSRACVATAKIIITVRGGLNRQQRIDLQLICQCCVVRPTRGR